MSATDPLTSYDAVVIGGGPAGLQAALPLGRMHRRVLLLDSGEYRNATAEHLHNGVPSFVTTLCMCSAVALRYPPESSSSTRRCIRPSVSAAWRPAGPPPITTAS